MKNRFIRYIKRLLLPIVERFERPIETNRVLLGKQLINSIRTAKKTPERLADVGFKVFSQWDEDGIIQYLISKVPIINKVFVEFGVEDYRESNTRFLLVNDNWKGLIMDSDPSHIRRIKSRDIYSRHDLVAVQALVTRENINSLIGNYGITGDIGLLSIDIDGIDYWVWEAMNVITPRIVICEYNSVFGSHEAITIPYNEKFQRTAAHHSNLYFGASLKALCLLARKKGYKFVGSNIAGINAFFVREDVGSHLEGLDCEAGYVEGTMRESRDESGRFTYVTGTDRLKVISHLKVLELTTNRLKNAGDIKI